MDAQMTTLSNLHRYSRQVILRQLGLEGQKKLRESSIAIIGCGALGTNAANLMTMMGAGHIKVVDRDYVELSNLHRQVLYDEEDVEKRLPKAVALAKKLEKINSEVEIEAIVENVDHTNIEKIIDDVDIVIDATDNFETRFLINDACVKLNKPWIYGAILATYGMAMGIKPGETACFRCLLPTLPPPGIMPTCDIVGIIPSIASLIASIQVTEALKILLGQNENGRLIYVDIWSLDFNIIPIPRRSDCPACSKGIYEYLEKGVSRTTILCGQESIHISPRQRVQLDLKKLGNRLKEVGKVVMNDYLIQLKIDPYELVIFSDGRALVKGTSDERVAMSLYSRYIGH